MQYKLIDLIDVEKTQKLLESFSSAIGVSAAIIDLEGAVLVASPWQRVCTDFHRRNDIASRRCIESDTILAADLLEGKTFSLYRCLNGLTDAASPIIIEGKHFANAFIGQFFTEKPDLEFFRRQAAECGFDETAYLAALSEIPVVAKQTLPSILTFLTSFAEMTASLGLRQLRQLEAEKELMEARLKLEIQNEELQASHEDLNRAQAVANIGSWRLDVRRNVLDWSDETYRIFGIPGGASLTYEAFLAKVHPGDREMVDRSWQAALQGSPYNIEHRILAGDTVKWVHTQAELEFDEQGVLRGGFGTVQDITGRKHADEELQSSREWFRVTLNSIGDAVIATDAGGVVTFLNPVAAALTGWKPEEAVGQPIRSVFNIISEQTRQPAENIVECVLRAGCMVALANHSAIITADGREIPIEDSAAPIKDEAGNLIGVVLVFHDVTEKRRTQEALLRSETMLRSVLDQMPSGVTVRDADTGALILSNARSREILGELVDIPEQFTRYRGYHTDGREYRSEEWPVARSIASGEVIDAEEIGCDRYDGARVTISVSSAPVRDSEGRIAMGVSVFHDISETRKQEEELRRVNRTLRALSNTIEATIHASDVSDLLNAVCRIIVDDCDYPMVWIGFAEHDENKTIRPVAQAGFEEGYLETIKVTWSDTELGRGPAGAAIRTGTPDVCVNMLTESRMHPWREEAIKRGYASSVSLPLKTDEDTLGVLTIYSTEPGSFSDDEVKLLAELADNLAYGITALRLRLAHQQAEKELQESRTRLDLALRSADMGTWHWDIAENTRCFDDQACYLLGIDPGTFTGTPEEVFGAIHPDDCETIWRALDRTLEQDVQYEAEYRALRPDGSANYVAARGKLVRDDEGRPVRLNGLLWDITERRQIEERLRRSRDELELRVRERTAELRATIDRLELLNQELQEFAFIASHDLQEPLRKIQTFGEMAKKRSSHVLDSTSQEYLDRVLKSANRMRQLLRDLLQFSRVASKAEPFKEIELLRIVREAADIFEARVRNTDCRIEIGNMPAVEADESQMLQLFQNLISNALKFHSGENPRVKVYGSSGVQGACEIFVEDNGIGFDPQFAERIFKPFERLHGRGEYDGTGMGLAICRKIVERHKGSIRAESMPGKGSRFIIRLPLRQTSL